MLNLPAVLNEFPGVGAALPTPHPLLHQSGFSGADIWPVFTEAGHYAVRRWPPGVDRVRLTGLHHLLEFLGDNGLNFVAVPKRTRSGTTLVEQAGRLFQVERWLPGFADYRSNPNRTRLAAAMAALASWHLAAARFQPAREYQSWFASAANEPSPAVVERRQRLRGLDVAQIRGWRDAAIARTDAEPSGIVQQLAELVIRHATSVASLLDLAVATTVPLQPVLRDVWHDHLLFSGDEVTGLIDPSACRSESVAADLSRLLGSFVGNDRDAWDFALQEYQRHRPLLPAELALIPILDRSGVLLSAVTWLEWLGGPQPRMVDPRRAQVRLVEIVSRLEAM
jgi:Ser/Thr protein kinase RdoA (MazF antagonist)